MQTLLSNLLDHLVRAEFFEEAAPPVLGAMVEVVRDAVTSSRFAGRGTVSRAMIHVRPADGYRRLFALEGEERQTVEAGEAIPHLSSATAWRWVAQQRAAVSVDVMLGRVEGYRGDGPAVLCEHGAAGAAFDSRESAQRLLDRAVTHLHVVPLRARGGVVEGMITIDAECNAAIGQAFVWPACARALQVIADAAAPYLFSLPPRPATAVPIDPLLPVVGPTMASVVRMLDVFAQQEETLLLGGPTGAGKSRLSRWCHERSRRRARPFEAIDLMAIPEELQLAELFGWRKGAFTGAVSNNRGSLARVEGGTLFIDEIDKLSLKAQAGLLQVLEEKTYRQLGEGSGAQSADVRFIVGTNADLRAEVAASRFREDLYYRINVLAVRLPPLAERRDEIVAWVRHMAERRHRQDVPDGEIRVTPAAQALLGAEPWPGNLRQLDNIVRRAYAFAILEAGRAPRDLTLSEAHVRQALGQEHAVARRPLPDALRLAAAAFVDEAGRLDALGAPLDLDLADAFRGLVVGAAVQQLGSREAAFKLLGKGSLVANRNHHKALRRDAERVEALCRALGVPADALLTGLTEPDER
jgi:DNA-binding NtrC family response regulator